MWIIIPLAFPGCYGASGLRLGEGIGVVVSSPEIQLSIPCNPIGETIVELHLFCRSRGDKEVVWALSRYFFDGTGAGAPGIFGYAEARGLTSGWLFGSEHTTIGTLIENLFLRGFESTVKFAKSVAYLEEVRKRPCPT